MDWKLIIQELGSHGLTQALIAAEIGVKQSTIAGILSGAQQDMRWKNGEQLRRLHARVLSGEYVPPTKPTRAAEQVA